VTQMTDEEWKGVQEALVVGGLRECIDNILASRFQHAPPLVPLGNKNRKIIERAYDDGEGHGITLVPTGDPPWFAGVYEDSELMLGLEHNGTLYSIVHASGGGLCSVIVGRGLLDNEMGIAFHGVGEAKAYVEGLIAK
jgi:hypothetical protein